MASIFLDVESGHSHKGVSPGSTALPAPLGERSNRGSMTIDRFEGQPFITECLQGFLDAAWVQVGLSINLGH